MATRIWKYLSNTFDVLTRKSYKKALSLGVDHRAKLDANQSDPVVADLLSDFDPVLTAYLAADQNLSAALGTYKGETQTVEELFEELSDEKLSFWEGKIFFFYPKGTTNATKLFPNARGPFNSGTYEQRIQAIKVLGEKCAADTDLNPVSVNILAFHTQIESARALQQSDGEAQVDTLRDLRETARVALCAAMYADLGMLMHRFSTEPVRVEAYFDLTLLRTNVSDDEEEVENSINGQITEQGTGAGLPAVNVTMTSPDSDPITVQTDDSGNFIYVLPDDADIPTSGLQITVTAEKEGYITVQEVVTLLPDSSITLDIEMELEV